MPPSCLRLERANPVWKTDRFDGRVLHHSCAERWAIHIVTLCLAPRSYTGRRSNVLEVVLPPMSSQFLSQIQLNVNRRLDTYEQPPAGPPQKG